MSHRSKTCNLSLACAQQVIPLHCKRCISHLTEDEAISPTIRSADEKVYLRLPHATPLSIVQRAPFFPASVAPFTTLRSWLSVNLSEPCISPFASRERDQGVSSHTGHFRFCGEVSLCVRSRGTDSHLTSSIRSMERRDPYSERSTRRNCAP